MDTRVQVYRCVYIDMYICIAVYIDTHVYIYIYTYIYMSICLEWKRLKVYGLRGSFGF